MVEGFRRYRFPASHRKGGKRAGACFPDGDRYDVYSMSKDTPWASGKALE